MIETGFDYRVKIQQIIENQLPEFLLSESPKFSEFLKQYYISQEFQSGPVDIGDNLDQYLKLDNLTPEVVNGSTTLSFGVDSNVGIITVTSTKGFPSEYGLLKIDDEIITYTGITTNTFTGCIRGFSGITTYHQINQPDELVFSTSNSADHTSGNNVQNLSSLFLQEFYKKIKYTLTPGLENTDFVSNLDVSNFIKQAKNLYQTKGTEESFRILFNVLYGETPKVIDLEQYLIKPSSSEFLRREVLILEKISTTGDPTKLVGQTLKRTNDPVTQGSISEVEILTRSGTSYYKVSLFIGYNDKASIQGQFVISGKSKVLETTPVDSSIISVDSTIGFPDSGTLISGNNIITYTSKSVNQFFGCVGVSEEISVKSDIRSDETVYSYENGDVDKEIVFRITGVLSSFTEKNNILFTNEGERIYVKNLGEVIKNPSQNKTYKEIFANSWIYNTSSRYEVFSTSGSTLTLRSNIDKSSLNVGDYVEILLRNSETLYAIAKVTTIDNTLKQVTVNITTYTITQKPGYTFDPALNYDIRRKIKKSSSSFVPLEFGNDKLIANIQNVYSEDDNYGFIASNSLPEYPISKKIASISIPNATGSPTTSGYIQGYDSITLLYSTIAFSGTSTPFKTGDIVVYQPQNQSIPGLQSGSAYYVEVLSPKNKIRLYESMSFIGETYDSTLEYRPFVQFQPLSSGSGSHTFTLQKNVVNLISPQKILRKFPLVQDIKTGKSEETGSGFIGSLINGVEIVSQKSDDRVYYGPLSELNVLNPGKDYDVINPPKVVISDPDTGTTALANVSVRGSVKNVFVDPQDFDIQDVLSVTISGGNGSGAIFKPLISKRYRELEFDAREISFGGGIDITNETITFKSQHSFSNGEAIIYNSNGNLGIGLGNFGQSNATTIGYLVDGSEYYTKIINSSTIQLYNTFDDYLSGINTVGFSTVNNIGVHKFRTLPKNCLSAIKVINPGSGYENRQLYVKSSGISTITSQVYFPSHNFNDGELVTYSKTGSVISGLSTANQYYILKVDEDHFKLANAGVGGTNTSYYERRYATKFSSTGSGYQIFSYPNIKLTVNVSLGSSITGTIDAVPVVTGEIVDAYVYEPGTGYGSLILNHQRKPTVTLKTGKNAEVAPIVSEGKIINVDILSAGSEYYSIPNLVINGNGSGAILRPVISNNRLTDIIVINSGTGYDENTTIRVSPAGSNALLDANVRDLTVNKFVQFNSDPEILILTPKNNLQYSYVGYSTNIGANYLGDLKKNGPNFVHSPIIGWAYDGNPIYGPYGYSDPLNIESTIKLLSSGYQSSTSNITDRPSGFDVGFFIEDYAFNDSGDLDIHNGRYTKTPEFPNGVYAYFATVAASGSKFVPSYPYFIGNSYRSSLISENNLLDQSYDFNNSSLIRNTLPYKVNDEYASNDFLIESNEVTNQISIIESVSKGSVEGLQIINSGYNYKIGDSIVFDDGGTGGGGVSAFVYKIEGKPITSIQTIVDEYPNTIFTWKDGQNVLATIDPYHTLDTNDGIIVTGLSTSILNLNGLQKVEVNQDQVVLFKNISSNGTPGIVEDIYVSNIPNTISIGSSIAIDSEIFSVLNKFEENSVLRVLRNVGSAHSISTSVTILPNNLSIPVKLDYFDSKLNDVIYFNPTSSVGVGTTLGASITLNYNIGETIKEISVPTQSIYLPNHPFKSGQLVTFNMLNGSTPLSVSNTSNGSTFSLPLSGNSQDIYIINKGNDYVGLTTNIGLTTNTNGLFFIGSGSDNYQYSLESNYYQVTGTIEKITSIVSVSTSHELKNGDLVTLQVNPNISVGIGTSTAVRVKYNQNYGYLLVNQTSFTSTAINTSTNEITINSYGLKTGDKVFYESSDTVAPGLTVGPYFVYKINNNLINLCQTYLDTQAIKPNVVNITGVGGNGHKLSLINPQIPSVRNCNLTFDLSDSTLTGYDFKLFYDKDFCNEFISTGNDSTFNVVGTATSLTINYSNNLPSKLYYTLSKNGNIISSDSDVKNNSEIIFIDSVYNGTYKVFGIGSTTFNISLNDIPENLYYTQNNTEILKYSTRSINAKGGVNSVTIQSGGSNYKEIPSFVKINSDLGSGADIIPISTNIGKINRVRFLDQGFEYASDKTLRPEAAVSATISIKHSSTIESVEVLNGGRNYLTTPNLIVYNPISKSIVDTTSLKCNIVSGSILSVDLFMKPYGLDSVENQIFAINNSNGISITSVSSIGSVVECTLSTPILGFSTSVFAAGDQVFIEGISKEGTDGSGFNSSDYDYSFFTVSSYQNTSPAKVTFDLSDFTANPGIAKTVQTSFPRIIKAKDYPEFKVNQSFASFIVGEQLLTDNGDGLSERDLYITESAKDYIKVRGSYELSIDETLKGRYSSIVAKVSDVTQNIGIFEIDYGTRLDYGWISDTGKLSTNYQVCSDNDYYQNLSYSVKSSITFDEMVNPVNRLLHTSGLKNFADTTINSSASVSYASTTSELVVLDLTEDQRVDAINNFDVVLDIYTYENSSKYLKLKNKKLASYVKCSTNRVLVVDDISNKFINQETNQDNTVKDSTQLDVLDQSYSRYLVQISDINTNDKQLSEIIVLNETQNQDIFVFEKSSLTNTSAENTFGNFYGYVDTNNGNIKSLRFSPTDIYTKDYDIKVLSDKFTSSVSGVGTDTIQSIGFVQLIGSNISVDSGSSQSIVSFNKDRVPSVFASIELTNSVTNKLEYVELFVTYDGNDTYSAEYYFNDELGTSNNFIGEFNPTISGNTLSIDFNNTDSSPILVRSKVVGFGTTSIGTGVYRFQTAEQPDGTERSIRFESNYSVSTSTTDVVSINSIDSSTLKALVKVSYGKTSALHQVMMVQDGSNVYTTQYPFISVGSTAGIGTFGGVLSGPNTILKFYPDSNISANFQVESFNEIFYTDSDFDNQYPDLNYGSITDQFNIVTFDGINGNRVNKTEFDFNYNGIKIYAKTFNPSNSSVLNLGTGVFTINDHFFSNTEKLIYTPKSTVVGVAASSLVMSSGANLPSEVYAVRINSYQIGLATNLSNASAGLYVTFSSYGSGNAHQLEMEKKLEKTIITIDGVVQQPLSYSTISYKLQNNGGQISAASSYFGLSGISTIRQNNLLKINNEFMKIIAVGVGTTTVGPISGQGNFNIINVERGFVGTIATSHLDSTTAYVYKGSFNIVNNAVYFTEPPKGRGTTKLGLDNLPYPTSQFSGRVYLRNDYTTNKIYDDISSDFTGIGQTYTLKVQGINTTGITTGNGVLFINDVFQTPITLNNTGNDYYFETQAGITSVVFTGITSQNGQKIITDFDVNQNQLPRGGLIVSLGSTNGLGFAPLVGASVTAVVDSLGAIVSVGLGSTDILGSGYYGTVSIGISDPNHIGNNYASISATIGVGGSLTFTVGTAGTGYVNPIIQIPSPSYEDLPIIGVSRRGLGNTTKTGKNLLVSLDVGASSTTGIGSTTCEVKSFRISRPGYGFEIGDVFKPVGLVTAKGLTSPIKNFELTVLDIFDDSFYAWQFGELNYIDSIKNLQDGIRTRFPLYYNSNLLSFEKDSSNPDSASIDLNAVLLIFINGVIQEPGDAYQFDGGTSFTFSNPPIPDDKIDIFFYQGTSGVDSSNEDNIIPSIKVGDSVQVYKNDQYSGTITQNSRIIENIRTSDTIDTNLYTGLGIDTRNLKPITWTKQKTDKVIGGELVYKTRDSLETQVYPTAKIIRDIRTTDNDIFVDDSSLFDYENVITNDPLKIPYFDGIIVQGSEPVSAALTAIVSTAGTIKGLKIVNAGSGYTGSSLTVKIAPPKWIKVGVGTTATATVNVSAAGTIYGPKIVNPGYGYTIVPNVIVESPKFSHELVTNITLVEGFSGIITGITTTSGTGGNPKALKFFLQVDNTSNFVGLVTGYPIYISNTPIGNGVTSINTSDSRIVGIGTSFLDNIYYIHNGFNLNSSGQNAEIICNILSTTNTTGLAITGSAQQPVGKFSWGRLSPLSRSNPIAIGVSGLTIDSGLSTFPTIQRRVYGLRKTGSLKKDKL